MATAAGKTPVRESTRDSTHSGRLLLRMPRALHARLAAGADAAGLSLNQYIVETLTAALDGERRPDADAPAAAPPRSLRLALVVNAVVVALAATTCVVLLVVGLR